MGYIWPYSSFIYLLTYLPYVSGRVSGYLVALLDRYPGNKVPGYGSPSARLSCPHHQLFSPC